MEELKPCPFCGGTNLDFSHRSGSSYSENYRIAVYCKSCRAYGPRLFTTNWKLTEEDKQLLINKCNERK